MMGNDNMFTLSWVAMVGLCTLYHFIRVTTIGITYLPYDGGYYVSC